MGSQCGPGVGRKQCMGCARQAFLSACELMVLSVPKLDAMPLSWRNDGSVETPRLSVMENTETC